MRAGKSALRSISLIEVFVKGSIIIRDVCTSNAYSFQNV